MHGVSTDVAAPWVTIGLIAVERGLIRTASSEGRVGRRNATRCRGCGAIGRRAQNADDRVSAAASGMATCPGPAAFGARMRSRVSSAGPASGGWRTGGRRQILPVAGTATHRQTTHAAVKGKDVPGGRRERLALGAGDGLKGVWQGSPDRAWPKPRKNVQVHITTRVECETVTSAVGPRS